MRRINLTPSFLKVSAVTGFALMIANPVAADDSARKSRLEQIFEEVVVTARKREEGLQDAPIAISAFSGASLEARGITTLNDIQTVTPNLTFYSYTTEGASTNNANLYIRGVGQADFAPTADPGVGLYVDGVYYGRSVGSVLDLIDLERVEVLRGPQGTLFGRNTIGGAVSIHTKKPHEEFEGSFETTVGTDSKFDNKLSVNVPLTDNLFSNFSVLSKKQDGYVTHGPSGRDLGDKNTQAARLGLLWDASDDLEVFFSADYSTSDENGIPRVFDGVFFDGTPGGENSAYAHNVLFGINGTGANGCDGTPANPAGSLNNPACLNDQFKGTNNSNGDVFSDTDAWGASLSVEWAVSDSVTFRSISSYRELDASFGYDSDTSPLSVVDRIEDDLEQEQVTQEFQLLYSNDHVDLIFGLYYFQEEGENPNPVSFVLANGGPTDILSGGDFDNSSEAAFTQATWHVTDKLDLTAGVRWTEDTKRFTPDQFVTSHAISPPPVFFRLVPKQEFDETFDDVTSMLNVSYQWNDSLMTYATYSEGFKGGGFTQRLAGPFPALPSFEPETVKSHEVGFKYSNDDGSFTVNAAAFYVDYEDIQITVFLGIAPTLDNAGTATVKGAELETKVLITDGWFFEGAAGYIDAGYDKVDPTTSLTGDEDFARTPMWTFSSSLTNEIDLQDNGFLVSRIDWSFRSETEFGAENEPGETQGAYSLWNASVAWTSPGEQFAVTAGVRNLDDKEFNYDYGSQSSFGSITFLPDRGREWYLTGKYKF